MKTLNGITRPFDAFIQTICDRTEKLKFDSLWEECIQEETRVANREVLLARDDDQAKEISKERTMKGKILLICTMMGHIAKFFPTR
jgi:hypothetical protein